MKKNGTSGAHADQALRERIAREVDRSFAVTAGAGSGKTSVLVERVTGMLEAGVQPRQIAVITFTLAAANEARARIFDHVARRLSDAGERRTAPGPADEWTRSGPAGARAAPEPAGARAAPEPAEGRTVPGRVGGRSLLLPLDAARRAALQAAEASLPELTVSTLHAFALDLLGLEALEAGWLPSSRLEEGVLGADLVPSARAAAFRILADSDPARAADLRARCRGFQIDAAAHALLRFRDLDPAVTLETLDDLRGPLSAAVDAVSFALEANQDATCKLLDVGRRVVERVRSALDAADPAALATRLEEVEVPKVGRIGRRVDWAPGGIDRARGAIGALREQVLRVKSLAGAEAHRRLMALLRQEVLPRVGEAKRRRGAANFDDLLFAAVDLLRERPEARARLRRRFTHILVDEVQDTDPLQAELVSWLARDAEQDDRPWQEARLSPGRVFVVGDPKQSIYRFRRADAATWDALRGAVTLDGEEATLERSFRSVPGIVGFVNHAFRDMPGYAPLASTRAPAALDPVVVLDTPEEEEPEAIARHLLGLKATGEVWDAETEALRPLAWRDVLVLVPTWAGADELHDRLSAAGIPSFVDGGRQFFQRDEVRLALAALRALEDPGDAEAVVFVLRGLFGCSFEDLARHKVAGGHWRYTMTPKTATPCLEGLGTLKALHQGRRRAGLVGSLDALLEASGAELAWALMPRAVGIAANLDKVRELVRRLEAEGASPAEVVERLIGLSEEGDPEEDLPLRPFEADAVEITTLFKAKGRERPVVALAAMRRKTDAVTVAVDRSAGQVAIKAGDLVPLDWETRRAREQAEAARERQRWMYVAATRARDHLVLCWSDGRTGAGDDQRNELVGPELARDLPSLGRLGHGEVIELHPGVSVRVLRVGDLSPAPRAKETFGALGPAIDAALAAEPVPPAEEADAFAEALRSKIRDARRKGARWRAVRDVARARLEARFGKLIFEKTGAGPAVGKAVHRTLEALDLALPEASVRRAAIDELKVHAVLERLTDLERATSEGILESLLGHAIFPEIRRAPERWHEVPFAFPAEAKAGRMAGPTIVNGVIDLCFPVDPERQKWVVVDWKTDRPKPGSPGERSYEAQIALYARALIETRVGRRIEDIRTVLVGPVDAPDAFALLELVDPAVREDLEAAMAEGAPPPDLVGAEAGEGQAELVWEDVRVALLLGEQTGAREELEREGFQVFHAPEAGPAPEALWARLGRGLPKRAHRGAGPGITLSDDEAS